MIRNCTCRNSTVLFLDRLSTLDCCCQRRSSDHLFQGSNNVSEVGSRPRSPRSTRWNASSCIIETDGRDCGHNCARLRIHHLGTAASSQDSRRSRFSVLLAPARQLSSVSPDSLMRFFLSFPPAIGYVLFSPGVGYALFLWLTSTIHLLSTSNPRLHLVAHLEPQNLLRSIQQEVMHEVLRHSRTSFWPQV